MHLGLLLTKLDSEQQLLIGQSMECHAQVPRAVGSRGVPAAVAGCCVAYFL
jgi:hypothetical protein